MRVLFARVGYMKYYKGPRPDDQGPIGGGSYNAEDVGGEVYNFLDIKGSVYGYFQPNMHDPYHINLARIEAGWTQNKIDDVLVIWFATDPIKRGQVIVGWYKEATVYRERKNRPGKRDGYYIKANADPNNAVLLGLDRRTYPIGHALDGIKKGNPGQSNAFYLLDAKKQPKDLADKHNAWIKRAIDYVTTFDGPSISSPEDEAEEEILSAVHPANGQGFQSNVKVRLAVESHAMNRCLQYYRRKGYIAEDVSRSSSYDVRIKKNRRTQFVEVKGMQGTPASIILTRNEVNLNRKQKGNMILFVVHSITIESEVVATGGTIKISDPWRIDERNLQVIAYLYTSP
ncbi:MAG TPA: DUF3883 domain-containing protein [Acidiferrobacter sp.]|nr:DUF3883 domain-containing protein [Acidiferrobacter sp.]